MSDYIDLAINLLACIGFAATICTLVSIAPAKKKAKPMATLAVRKPSVIHYDYRWVDIAPERTYK